MTKNRKLRIVVVEDNILYQQLIAKQLEGLHSSLFFYTSGEACISGLIDQQPEVIVMDYNLEGAMTGLDTIKAIRELLPDVYVILFTDQRALWTPENRSLFGGFDFVEKSDNAFDSLEQKIRSSHLYLQKI